MISTVPGIECLAGHVVEHPALARVHARLVHTVAEDVVVAAHDDAVLRVDHFALVAFDIKVDTRAVELLGGWIGRGRVAALEPVMSNGEKGSSEHIEVGSRRSIRV